MDYNENCHAERKEGAGQMLTVRIETRDRKCDNAKTDVLVLKGSPSVFYTGEKSA